MKFEEIKLENIGPIDRAAIGRHRLSVFIGPNNSGKSIAAKIMHGVRQLDPAAAAQRHPTDGGRDRSPNAAMSSAILRAQASGGATWSPMRCLPAGSRLRAARPP